VRKPGDLAAANGCGVCTHETTPPSRTTAKPLYCAGSSCSKVAFGASRTSTIVTFT
jgi:hypothetical protein